MKDKEIFLKVSVDPKRIKEEMKREDPYYQLKLARDLFINAIIKDTKRSPILRFFKLHLSPSCNHNSSN